MHRDASLSRLIRNAYFVVLGGWIAAYAVLAVAATMIFREARRMEPVLGVSPFTATRFQGEQAEILGGYQFGAVFAAVSAAMSGVLVTLVVLWVLRFVMEKQRGLRVWMPSVLLIAVAGLFAKSLSAGQDVNERRDAMYAASVEVPAEREAFDAAQESAESAGKMTLAALVFLLIVSLIGDATAASGDARVPRVRRPGKPEAGLER